MDPVVAAEAGVARDNHACADPGTGTDLYVLVDDCIGADLDVGSELRAGMDDGSRVNEHLTVARSSGCASAPISMPFESDLPRSEILAASGLAGEASAGLGLDIHEALGMMTRRAPIRVGRALYRARRFCRGWATSVDGGGACKVSRGSGGSSFILCSAVANRSRICWPMAIPGAIPGRAACAAPRVS